MPLVLYILRLLLDLLVGWWRDAAPLAVRRDGRLQTWTEDDAAESAVGWAGESFSSWWTAPGAEGPPRRPPVGGDGRASG